MRVGKLEGGSGMQMEDTKERLVKEILKGTDESDR